MWNQALHSGDIISRESYVEATTSPSFPDGYIPYIQYGLGLAIEEIVGKRTIGHLGQIPGFHSELLWVPEERLTFAYLSNSNLYGLGFAARPSTEVLKVMFNQ